MPQKQFTTEFGCLRGLFVGFAFSFVVRAFFFPSEMHLLKQQFNFLSLLYPLQWNLPNGPDRMMLHSSIFAVILNSEGRNGPKKYTTGAEVSQPIPSSPQGPQAPMRLNHRVNTNLICQFQQIQTASSIKEQHSRNMYPIDLRFKGKVLLSVKGQENHYRWC